MWPEFYVEGPRRGIPVKSRVANFSEKKKGALLLGFSGCGCGKKQNIYMGCSGRSFAVEGSRRGKPLKRRVANFSKKKGIYFGGKACCVSKMSGVKKLPGVNNVWDVIGVCPVEANLVKSRICQWFEKQVFDCKMCALLAVVYKRIGRG